MEKPDIASMTPDELSLFMKEIGEAPYRARQVFSWIHKGARIDEMSNLSKKLREKLSESAEYKIPRVEKKLESNLDGTVKYLMSLYDGECVECVLMRHNYGTSLCISSQVGCRMGCAFCASTKLGLVRNLAPSELIGQVAAVSRDAGVRIDKIVMMGIGEPLDNYDNVIKFLRLVREEDGLGIGLRNVSLSTCGIVPGIIKLSEEGLPVTLSVSLHAYNDEIRRGIMPIAKKYSIDELMSACRRYFEVTGRRVSFEYTLIAGKNDSPRDAEGLSRMLKTKMKAPCHVNLILLNEVDETGLSKPDRAAADRFARELERRGINATIRRSLGGDINAACGQLRRNFIEIKE